MKYESAFSADSMDVGQTNILHHTIDIKDKTEPAYRQQFRLAADHLQLIKDNMVGWMKAGILEKSNSKYNSPVFCVPKKDGLGLRVVLDYRLLNHKYVPDKYSIRTINQCLEDIGHA